MIATMTDVLNTIEGADGMQATYGGGDYTITVWDDMEGGYDVVFTRSNTDLSHEQIRGLNRDETIAKMSEFNADASAWYAVQYGE